MAILWELIFHRHCAWPLGSREAPKERISASPLHVSFIPPHTLLTVSVNLPAALQVGGDILMYMGLALVYLMKKNPNNLTGVLL